ncbi:MAG: 5-deoxy-glucuronate isomerase [Planctomycetia bacterium]|nr:5-deoxy-glucuronate isomerase [Planctomycetia bacterium]MDO5113936.1 5-deoxy-glucuronate isomerase [Planctomycetia bacterium]
MSEYSYKKSWNKENGKSEIITEANSSLSWLEVDMLKLQPGETKTYHEEYKEYGLVILGGKCTVTGEGWEFAEIGTRKDVFDGPATCVYVPCNQKFTISGVTEVSIAVCKSPGMEVFEPVLIRPEDVVIKDLGKPGWERQAHFILDERVKANLIYIGEAYVTSGNWASYPPHKHDDDNMPTEGVLEEIYYYEFDKPQGFGIQRVYTKEGDIDETYTVKSGDFVEIPKGYHPFCCAPGYNNYYLWIMAGENRGFFMTTEEGHKWLTK